MADAPRQFTAEQVRTLAEFADNVQAGRRMLRLIAWLGSVAIGIAALAYYLIGVRNGLHHPPVTP